MPISFKTDLCTNKPHDCTKRDWQQRSVAVWWLINKILWRNADKTPQKITILQGLSVCLQEFSLIWVGTRGMSESRLVLEGYCRIFVITAACEQSSTCFCRDHTDLLLVQNVAVPLYPLIMYSIYLLFSYPSLSCNYLSSGPNTSICLTCSIFCSLSAKISTDIEKTHDISNDQTVKWSLKLISR